MATKWLDYMLIREITDPKYIQQWTAAIMHPVSLLLYTVFCASLPAEQMKVYLRMHVVPKNPSSAIHYVRYLLKYHILSYRIFWSWSIRWCAGIKMYLHKKTCFKLIKMTVKAFIMLQKSIFQINAELPIHQRIIKKNLSQFPQNIWSSTTQYTKECSVLAAMQFAWKALEVKFGSSACSPAHLSSLPTIPLGPIQLNGVFI